MEERDLVDIQVPMGRAVTVNPLGGSGAVGLSPPLTARCHPAVVCPGVCCRSQPFLLGSLSLQNPSAAKEGLGLVAGCWMLRLVCLRLDVGWVWLSEEHTLL